MTRGKYIAFEGVPGTGKTTLTKFISERLGSDQMLEIVEDNPFLQKFYEDPDHWAFQTETFFLCNRYKQLQQVMNSLEDGSNVISDYHIAKNLIFANLSLDKDEFNKYKQLFNVFIDGFTHPDIIILSNASLKETLRRINLRGREMEKNIDHDYIDSLINAYNKVMNYDNLSKRYPGVQLLEIDADEVDFIKTPERYNDLVSTVNDMINNPELKHVHFN